MHAVAAAGLLASGLPLAIRIAGLVAVLIHACLRRPAPVPATLTLRADGAWELGGFGPARFVLGEGTAVGPFWALLRLVQAAGAGAGATGDAGEPGVAGEMGASNAPLGRLTATSVTVLLLRDQLPEAEWRTLSAVVNRVRPARAARRSDDSRPEST